MGNEEASFVTDIKFSPWYLVTQETEANKAVHNFELIFRDVLNKHAPRYEVVP